ncbi:hypothetical protein BM534_02675, partial [Clostridioides difficile]
RPIKVVTASWVQERRVGPVRSYPSQALGNLRRPVLSTRGTGMDVPLVYQLVLPRAWLGSYVRNG